MKLLAAFFLTWGVVIGVGLLYLELHGEDVVGASDDGFIGTYRYRTADPDVVRVELVRPDGSVVPAELDGDGAWVAPLGAGQQHLRLWLKDGSTRELPIEATLSKP